jgi:hypothetical protein
MLASLTFLVATAAVAPFLWFVWWMAADLTASRQSRRRASAASTPHPHATIVFREDQSDRAA